MKKLRTSRKMMALAIVPGVMASVMLAFALWAVVQFNIAIGVVIALALSAFYFLIVYFIRSLPICFNDFIVTTNILSDNSLSIMWHFFGIKLHKKSANKCAIF